MRFWATRRRNENTWDFDYRCGQCLGNAKWRGQDIVCQECCQTQSFYGGAYPPDLLVPEGMLWVVDL